MITTENVTSKDIQDNITELVSNTSSIPANKIATIANAFSNVISSSLGLGNAVIQGKIQKDIEIINNAEKLYGTTLNAVLKYLENRNLMKNEQRKICFQFYESFCADMSFKQKIKFKVMENEQTLKRIAIGGGIVLSITLCITLGTCYCVHVSQANKTARVLANSRQYQKTQRLAMKYAAKGKNIFM